VNSPECILQGGTKTGHWFSFRPNYNCVFNIPYIIIICSFLRAMCQSLKMTNRRHDIMDYIDGIHIIVTPLCFVYTLQITKLNGPVFVRPCSILIIWFCCSWKCVELQCAFASIWKHSFVLCDVMLTWCMLWPSDHWSAVWPSYTRQYCV